MTIRTIQFSRGFSAAHRVWNDPGKCHNIHGHNYKVEIEIVSDLIDAQGFIVPFDDVKRVIDRYDHVLIIDRSDPLADALSALPIVVRLVPFVPSTERLADHLATEIAAALPGHSGEVDLRLRETDGIQAGASVWVPAVMPFSELGSARVPT